MLSQKVTHFTLNKGSAKVILNKNESPVHFVDKSKSSKKRWPNQTLIEHNKLFSNWRDITRSNKTFCVLLLFITIRVMSSIVDVINCTYMPRLTLNRWFFNVVIKILLYLNTNSGMHYVVFEIGQYFKPRLCPALTTSNLISLILIITMLR